MSKKSYSPRPEMNEDFQAAQREALLSMDRKTITAFAREHRLALPTHNQHEFWMTVHMARTVPEFDLPVEERIKSRVTLLINGRAHKGYRYWTGKDLKRWQETYERLKAEREELLNMIPPEDFRAIRDRLSDW